MHWLSILATLCVVVGAGATGAIVLYVIASTFGLVPGFVFAICAMTTVIWWSER